ncbi:MAG: response regulator [Planctomycetota bacterium]
MKRLLFVDDEPNVLRALNRMLRARRDAWGCAFATGGPEALELMAKEPFDLIVSDMRMPGMDGAELLTRVMRDHPLTIRFALSGQADKETIYRSVGPTHQFLVKPCSAESLINTIDRAFALRSHLQSEALSRLVSQTLTLPTVPELYTRVMQELQSPDPSIAEVGRIIGEDPGMSAKMLQWANSAYVGVQERVSNPAEAVRFMGLEMVRGLVLLVGVFSDQVKAKLSQRFRFDRLWKHSMMVGACARAILKTQVKDRRCATDAFTAGILHDAGKLVLAASCPAEYDKVSTIVEEHDTSWREAEVAVFGASHAEVGALLLGLWGLPDGLVEAVAYHHCPDECLGRGFGPLTAVHIANALDDDRDTEHSSNEPPPKLDRRYMGKLGLEELLPLWRDAYLDIEAEGEG